jgi:exodeoxyribonuclease VII large subunit
MDQSVAGNVPEYSVSEISGAVKRTLEGAFGRVRVRGEVTELKRYPSGHIYFALKDENAKIAGVVWKSAVSRLGLEPENGVEVIATGRVSSYADRSSYQLIVERMEYAGAGALLARIEMLKQRLAEEGLFEAGRKKPIPGLPEVVGVVTSPQGAVIQDIRTTIARRFPRRLILWPVPVQGEGAAAKIAAAIAGFSALPVGGLVPRPDVLIVARGGGSLEDLMAFNEEVVLRAVAACTIPLISAVGHETDTTLIDFVSDRRAPTPTAAAEMAVPARLDLLSALRQTAARLDGSLARTQQERRLRLDRAVHALPDLPNLLGNARQKLDDRATRLSLALPNLLATQRNAVRGNADKLRLGLPALLARRRTALVQAERHMPDPRNLVATRRATLTLTSSQLSAALRHTIQRRHTTAGRLLVRLTDTPLRAKLREAQARLQGLAGQLDSLSPLLVLKRGYALVLTRDGHPVTEAAKVKPNTRLRLRFHDGTIDTTTDPAQSRLDL